ncbi:MAG: hypothetical protein KC635_28245 [Myxococcales bacterium]|nr:hypothetical protein [Myxococcales bacterium]MCB9732803.1 hypothetical protein [Deltaproteobacteria bacterium]
MTDVYAFPQLLGVYRNLLRIEMGSDANTGDGTLIFGTDAMAFGVVAHRGDNTDPFGALALPAQAYAGALLGGARSYPILSGIGSLPAPANIVDLMLALNMGDAAALGFRLGIANAGSSTTPDGGDSTGVSQTSINFGAGYSMLGEGLKMDLGLNLNIGLGSDSTAGVDNETTGSDIHVGVNARFYLPMQEQVDLAILGGIDLNFGGISTPGGDSSVFGLNIGAGVGPVYKLEHARLAAYAFLAFATRSTDPNTDADGDDSSTTSLTIPGVHMAMEVDLNEWLQFRAGLEYAWMINGQSDANNNSQSENTGSFGWSGGFGLIFDQFRVDISVNNAWFTSGPDFLGGDGELAANIAGTYHF